MQLLDKAVDVATALLVAAVMAISGGVMWLVRRVITNQYQIEMLHQSLKSRDQRLDEMRDDMRAIRQRMDGK